MPHAARNFSQAVTSKTDQIPQWNFDKFYPDVDSPEYEADFVRLEQWAGDFKSRYEGKIVALDGDHLAAAIEESKAMGDLQGKLGTYVQLKQVQDSKEYTTAAEAYKNRAAPLNAAGAFFAYEIKEIEEAALQTALKESSALRKFRPWLDRLRKEIPHTPPLNVTQYATEMNAPGGVLALYDKWHAAKRFEFEGKELNQTELIPIFANDPDQARRRAAHEAFINGLQQDSMLSAHLFNERLRLKGVDDKWANFSQPWDERHLANNVTADMVDSLEKAAKDAYPRVMQRFYDLKARLIGQTHLNIYDRNVNPFETADKGAKEDKSYIPFAKAKEIVLSAYRGFSPSMADDAEKFFDNGWIDAVIGKNKRGGAFSHPGAARLAHPMVMLNYAGTPRDVATMAHELGHGVHQVKAAHEGDAIVESPLTFAETASVFGEMLTFKELVRRAGSDAERRKLLFEKVSDMMNTVFRQISFHDFEKRAHMAFKKENRPLTEDEIGGHFVDALQESYGSAIPLD
ncbi:MAG TPA: M3 family metallopeptidase, partial [Micavibrio sp.]